MKCSLKEFLQKRFFVVAAANYSSRVECNTAQFSNVVQMDNTLHHPLQPFGLRCSSTEWPFPVLEPVIWANFLRSNFVFNTLPRSLIGCQSPTNRPIGCPVNLPPFPTNNFFWWGDDRHFKSSCSCFWRCLVVVVGADMQMRTISTNSNPTYF